MLDVPRELVAYLATLLAAERHAGRTRRRTRALTCWYQALFTLVWFRKREDLAVLGAGFGVSRATAYRYWHEAIEVLAATAPELPEALHRVHEEGWSHVALDGKVVEADRCAESKTSKKGHPIDAWYRSKTHDFGGNIQAVMRPDGFPVWVFEVEPGLEHDLSAAREHALGAL